MKKAWIARQKVPNECYLVVSLEELVRNPADGIKCIFEFCEIDFSADWLLNSALPLIDKDKAHIGRAMTDLAVSDIFFIWEQCNSWYWTWRLEA
jgi:hypothetical protein